MADSAHTGMIRPKGPKPAWAHDIHPEILAVIEKLVSCGARPIVSLTAEEARKNPTPAMAVMDLMKENNIPIPVPLVDTIGKNIPVIAEVLVYPIAQSDTITASYQKNAMAVPLNRAMMKNA